MFRFETSPVGSVTDKGREEMDRLSPFSPPLDSPLGSQSRTEATTQSEDKTEMESKMGQRE